MLGDSGESYDDIYAEVSESEVVEEAEKVEQEHAMRKSQRIPPYFASSYAIMPNPTCVPTIDTQASTLQPSCVSNSYLPAVSSFRNSPGNSFYSQSNQISIGTNVPITGENAMSLSLGNGLRPPAVPVGHLPLQPMNHQKPPPPLEVKECQSRQQRKGDVHSSLGATQSVGVQGPGPLCWPSNGTGASSNGVSNTGAVSPRGRGADVTLPAMPGEDISNLKGLLAEKDGAISILRSRLLQNDSDLHELRKVVGTHSTSLKVPQPQQRELERLASELSFKLFGNTGSGGGGSKSREKDERLKEALDTASALREELESLKKLRKIEAVGGKRRREDGAEAEVDNVGSLFQPTDMGREAYGECSNVGHKSLLVKTRSPTKQMQPGKDPWSLPWDAGRPLPLDTHGTASGPGPSQKHTLESHQNKALFQGESSGAVPFETVLRARTLNDGCVNSIPIERTRSESYQIPEVPSEEPTTTANGCADVGIETGRPAAHGRGPGMKNALGMGELTHRLQQIWGTGGARDDGVALLPEMFAVCREELYLLLTNEAYADDSRKGRLSAPEGSKCLKRRESLTSQLTPDKRDSVALKLHNTLANVANKLASAATLIGPLLEYCHFVNMHIVQSALHVLHCILHHNSGCRERVLGSTGSINSSIDAQPGEAGVSVSLKKLNVRYEGKGWFIAYGSPEATNKRPNSLPVTEDRGTLPRFSSPRIICWPLGSASNPVAKILDSTRTLPDGTMGKVTRIPAPKLQDASGAEREVPHGSDETKVEEGHRDLPPFVQWLLDLALQSLSSGVRFEATAIICILVVHSEPLVERAKFGPLFWEGGLESLLKESVGVDVQLQAVRLVHLLLHCPVLFQRFCTTEESIQRGDASETGRNHNCRPNQTDKFTMEESNVDSQVERKESGTDMHRRSRLGVVRSSKQGLDGKGRKWEGLGALAACLRYTGNSLQEYSLRRNVVRVLAFLTTSGDCGTAILVEMPLKQNGCGPIGGPTDDRQRGEGVIGVQSDSLQQPEVEGEASGGLHAMPGNSNIPVTGSSIGDGVDRASTEHARQGVVLDEAENGQSIPRHLVALLGMELDAEDNDEKTSNATGPAEERACLIREALTLLCQLSSHRVHSSTVLALLTIDKETTRVTLSALNHLIIWGSRGEMSSSVQKMAGNFRDMVELARGLRRQVMSGLTEFQDSL